MTDFPVFMVNAALLSSHLQHEADMKMAAMRRPFRFFASLPEQGSSGFALVPIGRGFDRPEIEPIGTRGDLDGRTIENFTEQDLLRQRILHLLLNHALLWPCTIGRIIALVRQPVG